SIRGSQAEHALGIGVKDLVSDVGGQTELVPLSQQPRIRKARVIAAEHDLVLQPAPGGGLEALGKVFRRPSRARPDELALWESSKKTLPLWSATAVISSIHGQPGWAATMVSVGKSAASSSMASGWACRIFAPRPPGRPAPMPVVPTSIITGAPSPAMVSHSG